MNSRLLSISFLAILALGVLALMARNRRLRSTLAGVLAMDAAILSVVLGIATQRPILRAVVTVGAITISLWFLVYLSPESLRHVRSEQISDKNRFLTAFVGCLVCAAMFTTALGFSRSIDDGVSRAVTSKLGAVDLLISAPTVSSLEAAQAIVRNLSGGSELASLFDSEPLPMRTILGGVLTNGSPAPVRLIEVSTVEAAGFGRSPQTSGLAGISLGSGEALLPTNVARLLGGKRGDSLRVRMVGGGDVLLNLKAISPSVGIVGLPMPTGESGTNIIVGPGTLASVPETQSSYLLALSLCGGPSSRVLSNGLHTQCSTDAVESEGYVKRVDGELARAFGKLAVAVDNDALFSEEVDPSTLDNGLSVSPIKLRVVEDATRDQSAIQRVLDLSSLPIGLCSLLGLVGISLFSRSRRIRIDQLVGINSMRSVGEQVLFVALSSFPAALFGSAFGVLIVRLGVFVSTLISQGRPSGSPSLLAAPPLSQLFADGLAASLGATIFAALIVAWIANRAMQKPVTGSQRLSRRTVLVRSIVGVLGLVVVVVGVKALFGSKNVTGLDAARRSSLLLLGVAIVLGSVFWLVFARSTNLGSGVAGVGLRGSERNLLNVLRSRSGRRAGVWELAGPVLVSFSLGTAVMLVGVLGTSAATAAQPVESPFVEVNDVYSNGDVAASSPIAIDGSGQVVETRTATVRGMLVATGAVSDRSLGTSAIREVKVGLLPKSTARLVLNSLGVVNTPGVDQVVAGRNDFNRAFGSIPHPGERVRLMGPNGLFSVEIVSVVDGPSNALWVNERTWAKVAPSTWFVSRLVSPTKGRSVKETRRDLRVSLRGRAVTIPDHITTATLARSDAARMSLQLRWVGLMLGMAALGALMFRWAAARRKELVQLRLSMIAKSTVTRSISHDLIGHVVSSALAGMVYGALLSAMLMRFRDLASSSSLASPAGGMRNVAWVYLLVAVGLFFVAAFLSARFGGSGGATRRTAQAEVVTLPAAVEAATA